MLIQSFAKIHQLVRTLFEEEQTNRHVRRTYIFLLNNEKMLRRDENRSEFSNCNDIAWHRLLPDVLPPMCVGKGEELRKEELGGVLVGKPNFPRLEIVRIETCSLLT